MGTQACPTEGQRRAREQQGCLPPCRAPAAIRTLGSHPSARLQHIDGIKSQAPRARSTASALTDSWHGLDQLPWSPRISWQQRTCASSGSTLLCPSNPDTCGHAGTGLEREPDGTCVHPRAHVSVYVCVCVCVAQRESLTAHVCMRVCTCVCVCVWPRGPASGGQEKSPASNSWEKESSASAVSLLPASFTFLGPHSLPSSVRL